MEMVTTLERPGTKGVTLGGKAAIYIRVSSHKQEDGVSLDVQLETCRRYCEKAALDVVAEFRDIESGLHVDRPQYQQALALARAKGFDQLVVYRYDRSGRDDAEYATMLRDFAKQGITLVSASGESPDPLYQKLAGVLAWDESRRISIRTAGSKMKRHAEGKWNGKPVFGYSVEKHPEGGSYLVPKHGEAELVTELFSRYASGRVSLGELRGFLGQVGTHKSRFSIWYILKNRVYLGEVPHGLKSSSPFMPKADLQWTPGKHQPLTDPVTFSQVQARLSDNAHRQRGGPYAKYLFSGLVHCGSCGHKYAAKAKRDRDKTVAIYRCNRRIAVGDCQGHAIYESRMREVVIAPLERLLAQLSQEDVRAALRAELVCREEDTRAADQITKLGAAATLERLEARLSTLEDAYLDGDIPRDRYRAKRDELALEIKELQAQLAAHPPLAIPNMEELFAVADALEGQPLDDTEWRHLIVNTLDRIVIDGRDIQVIWKPEFEPLVARVTAN
jgi:DNA invertase Pin-like site-specific DNA recombinase